MKNNKLRLYWFDSMSKICEYLEHIKSFAPTIYGCEVGSPIGHLLTSSEIVLKEMEHQRVKCVTAAKDMRIRNWKDPVVW